MDRWRDASGWCDAELAGVGCGEGGLGYEVFFHWTRKLPLCASSTPKRVTMDASWALAFFGTLITSHTRVLRSKRWQVCFHARHQNAPTKGQFLSRSTQSRPDEPPPQVSARKEHSATLSKHRTFITFLSSEHRQFHRCTECKPPVPPRSNNGSRATSNRGRREKQQSESHSIADLPLALDVRSPWMRGSDTCSSLDRQHLRRRRMSTGKGTCVAANREISSCQIC